MPRSSRSSRPAPRSSSSSSAPSGSRSASSVAAPHPPPAATAAPPQSQTKQPGMIAQMAATAGSVAVGSTIGHGISNMLFGGRAQEAPADAGSNSMQQTTAGGGSCEFQAKEFTKCLDAADVQTCSWFLEQLKACQAAASRY
ncbi:hypothetical protein FRC19_003265 [Serendipita sp. 401]|nr:hypothetical protein FRC19_003265 [Serendipita sp. 401]KAG9035743.1 hypothetical protein FS842_003655 [Serendipita sp. 407]